MPIEALESIHLEGNGSGKVFRQVFYRPAITKIAAWFARKTGKASFAFPLNEAKLKAAASGMGRGVTFLMACPQKNERGWDGYAAIYAFDDINLLQTGYGSAVGTNGKGQITFSRVDDSLEVRIRIENPSFESKPYETNPPCRGPENRPFPHWLIPLFDGFRIANALIVEDGIAETNATYVNRNSIVLLDVAIAPLLKLMEFPEILETLKRSKTLHDLKSAIGEVTGIRIETQPVVRVKLK